MKKIKAIVVEDEKEGMNNIVIKIKKHCPEVEIIAQCENPPVGLFILYARNWNAIPFWMGIDPILGV